MISMYKVQMMNSVGDVLFETTTACDNVRFNEEGTKINFLSKGELIISVEVSEHWKRAYGLLALSCNKVE